MFFKNILYGLIIGIGFIVPGVSGGVIATILGIYNIIIYKINHLFDDFKNNILYILPLFIGIFISVIFLSKLILYLINNKLEFISYVFIGLILGCIPYLIKEIKINSKKGIAIIPFITSFLFGIILYLIQINNISNSYNISIFKLSLAGILYSFGKIIPGISGASLLMFIGVYNYFLNIIANPLSININLIVSFIPFIISFLITSIILLKLMELLLNNYFRITYSAIIGFVISSILFIYPNTISITSILISILSFIISYYLSN